MPFAPLAPFALTAALALAQPAALPVELAPGVAVDPAIPTLRQVVGHDFGEALTSPDEIVRYLEALQQAAPGRARLIRYGESWEGRPLHVLAVGSADRIARLDALERDLARLADPRGLAPAEAERLVAELPVVVWLLHSVHGNEVSPAEAALAEAYYLLAATGDASLELVRREALVLIDPLQNPDGRARFLAGNELGRAAAPDAHPLAAERDEPWPGGRSNHYLFDMNRDWIALTQPETTGRIGLFLRFFPQVVVDLHEMGGEATYFFAPPAPPANPWIGPSQLAAWERFGRANAEVFDRRGFAWFKGEVFDAFYPGYGESWPLYHGAVGMTYEQASPRGLTLARRDGTTLTLRDAVAHHFTAALTTLETAARDRVRLLRDFLEARRGAVEEGRSGPVRAYLIPPGDDPPRAARLARLLAAQGIEVRQSASPIPADGRTLPAGTFVVAAAQPAGRLVRNLLDPAVAMDPSFLAEQEQRRRKRLPDEIYDVTAWSLALSWDVEVLTSARPVESALLAPLPPSPGPAGAPSQPAARVGYLAPWGTATVALAAEALRDGLAVRLAGESFRLGGRDYPAGTAFLRSAGNPADLAARLGGLAARHGVTPDPVDSGWVEEGMSLGSSAMRALRAPRVVLAWGEPASSLSTGWARWVLERRFGVPVTAVRVGSLHRLDLAAVDTLVLPSGDYSTALDAAAVERLDHWVRAGGTLVTLGEASRWAARQKVGLLGTTTELRDGRPEEAEERQEADAGKDATPAGPPAKDTAYDLDQAIRPERELPDPTPGALLRVELDREHWLAAGSDGEIQALVESRRVFTPIKLDLGVNVGLYAAAERLLAAGVVWAEPKAQLARKAFLIDRPLGDGHVIAFAEDPNVRGIAEATELLFVNAVLLGPAH